MFDSADSPDAGEPRSGALSVAELCGHALRDEGELLEVLWARELSGGELVAHLAASRLSPSGLGHLASVDLTALDLHDRVTALGLWDRYRSWVDARVQSAMLAVAGSGPSGPAPERAVRGSDRPDDVGREEVACALGLSSASAAFRLGVARELQARLPRTFDALSEGRISYWHAKALVEAVAPLEDAVARAVEAEMLDRAPRGLETLTGFRRRLDRVVIAVDPRAADKRHQVAVGGRRIVSYPEPDGMATVASTLTAAEAATMMAAVTALALGSRADGDDRPLDVLRADALAGLMAGQLAQPGLPSQQRARPHVGVTVDAATLAGLANNPGHLDGYGAIPPIMARLLAAEGEWHRLVTDPVSGALLDYGTKTYRPPAELVEFLTARDRTCRFPTCSRQARLCDLDHAVPFDHTGHGRGGPTSAAGMGCLCRRNHGQKTAGTTRLVSHPDGSATWTTPSGHSYHRPAVDHCPENTAHLARLRAEARRDDNTGDDPPDNDDPDTHTSSGNDPPPF